MHITVEILFQDHPKIKQSDDNQNEAQEKSAQCGMSLCVRDGVQKSHLIKSVAHSIAKCLLQITFF